MMQRMKNTPPVELFYIVGRDFGHDYVRQAAIDGDSVNLDLLEDAIYSHLTSLPCYAPFTVICRSQAEKAARRAFERAGLTIFSTRI